MIALVPRRAGSRRALAALAGATIYCAMLSSMASSALASSSQYVSAVSASGRAYAHGVRPQDEIVLVNVRPLCGSCDPELLATNVGYESYVAADDSGCRQWQPASLQAIVAADSSVPTIVFVHGNKITPGDAKHEGLIVYRRIVRQADSDAPIRFVIFSWPSSEIRGPLKDVRMKAVRTRPAGCQLAWFLDELPAETPVTLVGFSYGARIITGALDVLGGGSLGGLGLADRHTPNRAPMNAVLLASALNSDWLAPGHYHGQAMTQVNRMLLVNNDEDPAMKYYRFSTTNGRPQALGLCGPTCIDAEGAAKIVQRDVCRYVGNQHDLMCYTSAPGVTRQIWQYAIGL